MKLTVIWALIAKCQPRQTRFVAQDFFTALRVTNAHTVGTSEHISADAEDELLHSILSRDYTPNAKTREAFLARVNTGKFAVSKYLALLWHRFPDIDIDGDLKAFVKTKEGKEFEKAVVPWTSQENEVHAYHLLLSVKQWLRAYDRV